MKAAKSPVAAAKSIVTDPANAIASVPRGIMKFMGHLGETVKGMGEKHKGADPEGSQLQQLIGFSEAKRKIAVSLGVDPYSPNFVLQHELEGIAWAAFAGGATFSLATLPIGGPAGTALNVVTTSSDLQGMIKELSPADLRIANRKELLGMGVNAADTETFLNNNSFSPTAQTAFVLNLKSLKGVADRGAFVRIAGHWSSTEPDANFCLLTSSLMAKLHQGDHPLGRIVAFGDFPVCIGKDGTTIIALQWDYAAWTVAADKFGKKLQQFASERPRNGKMLVAISGQVSPLLAEKMRARGTELLPLLSPGPLKVSERQLGSNEDVIAKGSGF